MSRNRLPYFPFDVADYLNDPAVVAMGADSEGCYIRLLARMWQSPTPGIVLLRLVPHMADLHRIEDPTRRAEVMAQMEAAFDTDGRPGAWVQKRMSSEWGLAQSRMKSRRAGALVTNAHRWSKVAKRPPSDTVSDRSPVGMLDVDVDVEEDVEEESTPSARSQKRSAPPEQMRIGTPSEHQLATIGPNASPFTPTREEVERWQKLYPAVDVDAQLRAMAGWLDANPSRRKTRTGILRFINGWLAKEQNRGGGRGQPPTVGENGKVNLSDWPKPSLAGGRRPPGCVRAPLSDEWIPAKDRPKWEKMARDNGKTDFYDP